MTKEIPKKRCTKCGEERYLMYFARRKQSPDGLTNDCFDCRKKHKTKSIIEQIRDKQRSNNDMNDFRYSNGVY